MMEKGRSYLSFFPSAFSYEDIVKSKNFFLEYFDEILKNNCETIEDV